MHMIKELNKKLQDMMAMEMKEEADKKNANKVKMGQNYSAQSINNVVEKLRKQ